MSTATETPDTPAATGPSREQLDIEDVPAYPTGFKRGIVIFSILLCAIFVGLDMTIVAVAVPSLSNQFKNINDIGWYSASYQLISSSFIFFFARLYTVFSMKTIFLVSVFLFELGSLLCTVAPTSATFILGRAIAGLGSSGIQTGSIVLLTRQFPVHQRPFWTGLVGAGSTIAMVIAPLIGGVLIDAFSWRACFGINLPIGAIASGFIVYGFQMPASPPHAAGLTIMEKCKRLDIAATLVFVPAIICLLMGLQWGGVKYGWANVRIIVLLVLFAVLVSVFAFMQYRKKEDATLPGRIMTQRSVLAGAWFSACNNGILAVTEYYMSIYFQGVRGFSATESGAMGLPLFAGMVVTVLIAGAGTNWMGYYYPFMIIGSVLTPVASGLLTTIEYNDTLVKILMLLAFLGAGVGLGLQAPVVAVQTVLPDKDIATGVAITGFAGGLASALFVSLSAVLFQSRLAVEVERGGLVDVRDKIGSARLGAVLSGYDEAVIQTLYIPVALASLSVFASVAMERKSVKKTR
ncbi:Major facilitator superfamily domain general substrate transporter [Penicillium cf. griseofulvum]|uniref:Major facilitator superfamily domain general substrate transporter n=1 Tax=Penicillium cf. griseofulvum TaxID=2972120 RepID=A0A9W9J212_9EURO|nr:Major facilitator superfamily domain general substrate transporter [Penicillium cf. griseofulvum]KAJ5452049.1 Major facilitator superfamily domain general substrate transporter [Penicillium cf. griseofulvum]